MTGDQELLRVAGLMKLCASMVALIAKLRTEEDRKEAIELSDIATAAADRLEMLVTRNAKSSDGKARLYK